MTKRIVSAVAILALLLPGFVLADTAEKESVAIASAEFWLRLVDEGRYADSWKEASQYFKAAVNQDQWKGAMESARRPLGTTVSRTLKSSHYATSLPGAPDGEYVIIQYSTEFENKKAAIETVTPMLDKDGKWRISGYYIR